MWTTTFCNVKHTFAECDEHTTVSLQFSLSMLKKNSKCIKMRYIDKEQGRVIICMPELCENCRIIMSYKILDWIFESLQYIKDSKATLEFVLGYVVIIASLLSGCLTKAHTANIIVGGSYQHSSITKFVEFAVEVFTGANHRCATTEWNDNKIFKSALIEFSGFIKLLLKHSYQFDNSWWNFDDIHGTAQFDLRPHYEKISHHIYYFLSHECISKLYGLPDFELGRDLLLPLITFFYLFVVIKLMPSYYTVWKAQTEQRCGNKHWYYNLLTVLCQNDAFLIREKIIFYMVNFDKPHIWKQMILNYIKSISQFNIYLTNKEKELKYIYIECQWYRCTNRKIDLIEKGKKCEWKKCSGCQIARYCSRICQKLDWNKGFHSNICLFVQNR
eukprot:6879_1